MSKDPTNYFYKDDFIKDAASPESLVSEALSINPQGLFFYNIDNTRLIVITSSL